MNKIEQIIESVRTEGNGSSDRQSDGKFAPGNRAASGRRSRSKELRAAFEAAVTSETMTEVVSAMCQAARLGDVSAAKLITDQVLVKPNIESIVAERMAIWRDEVLHELLYALDSEYQRHVLRGSSSNVMSQTERIIRSLPSFRE